jgi:3-oxoacyl-[acyl-carrier protein] reductase
MATAKRVALITGGAKGIGRAIARHLASSGWRLGIIDLPGSGLRRAYPPGGNIVSIEGDVRDEAFVAGAVETAI